TNLVYENPDLAAKFIKQLSEVYRYVLDTRDRELVSKEEELTFLKSYVFLQKIRFGDSIQISIQLEAVETYFPPLVLQMLIENAIKHNIITVDQPLTIHIYADKDFVVVENKLQKKKTQSEASFGVGLNNIRLRYTFFTDREVVVEELTDKFIVRIPVIERVSL
ncbi:MAG: sensor histidine kinase, partial [Cyclobacteriaceae bacterium]